MKIPRLKKKIRSFLTKEDGKISKEALLKTGILLSAAALASLNAAADCPADSSLSHNDHCNDLSIGYDEPSAVATAGHNHGHGSHASHASHGSHGSHGSHNSW